VKSPHKVPNEDSKNFPGLADFLHTSSLLSLLFLLFYFLFIFFSPFIHKQSLIDLSLFNPWVREHIPQDEGTELPIMFMGSLAYLALSYLLIANYKSLTWFSNRIVQIFCFLPVLIIILRTKPASILAFIPNPMTNIVIIFSIVVFLFVSYQFYASQTLAKLRPLFLSLFWVAFALLVILSGNAVSPFDSGYFIGPALKLSQGEKLGSFYMQYGLGETYLFKWIMDFGLKLHQMQFVLGIIFIFWYLLYYNLASKLIKDKYLVFLFLISLVTIRFLALMHHPTLLPQVTPIRLELWVPLLLITYGFGFFSLVTATAFSFTYVLDNFFGFFYLAGYLAMLTLFLLVNKNKKELFRKSIWLAIPPALSLIFQLYFFGFFTSTAAKIYQQTRMGLMPISPQSMFWIIAAILPIYLYLTLVGTDLKLKRLGLFLIGLTLLQLVYFYGRSHEHNLLNLSGILLLVLFMCLDKVKPYFAKIGIYVTAAIIIILPSLVFARNIQAKFNLATSRLSHLVLAEEDSIDIVADKNPNLFKPSNLKIILISAIDSYMNYRYHLKQTGYFSPFFANIYLDNTVKFLADSINYGYTVVFPSLDTEINISEFNKSNYLHEHGLKFISIDMKGLSILKLIEATKSSTIK